MGRSFYHAKSYAQLRDGSQAFSDLINAAAPSYGLTTLQAASYQTLNDDYAAKYLLAEAPQTRTKGTLLNRNDAKVLLVAKASELAKIIDTTPTVTNGQRANLGLSVRSNPSPARAPGTCSNFKVELLNDGSIQMTWRANNPTGMTGVTYQVWRRFGSAGEFAFLGASGEKKFIDSTIPAGMSQVQYQVRGIRPTSAGEWAQHSVNFGRASIAPVASAVGEATATKLAA
ncbi:MAG: hypothetical protein WBD40_03795 [Tepidisphaeraceae bacterium]